jgi:hypothetical protein
MTTIIVTTIAAPAMIESMGAATVLVPHGAKLPPPPPLPTADSSAPSANAPNYTSSIANNTPMYASLPSIKDGGTTAPTALSAAAATAAPVATSTEAAAAPPPMTAMPTTMTPPPATPTAMPTTSFVKLNFI